MSVFADLANAHANLAAEVETMRKSVEAVLAANTTLRGDNAKLAAEIVSNQAVLDAAVKQATDMVAAMQALNAEANAVPVVPSNSTTS